MALNIGDTAPDFTLKSKNETGEVKDYTLSSFKGKNVVLFFFPAAFTGVCTKEMCSVSDDFQQYTDLNAVTFGISVDSIFTLEVFAKQNGIKIPLLSDFNKEVIGKYETRYADGEFAHNMNGVSRRAAFVVDKEGKIAFSEVLASAGDLPSFEKIKEVLKSLN